LACRAGGRVAVTEIILGDESSDTYDTMTLGWTHASWSICIGLGQLLGVQSVHVVVGAGRFKVSLEVQSRKKIKQPMIEVKNEKPAYLSLFSGIGGLEHPSFPPILFCEQDVDCHAVIQSRELNQNIPIHHDIRDLCTPPPASFVVGGWPCQDISSAGKQLGLAGARSGLFFDMLRVANAAGAHTIIGENVPNLLTLNGGKDFEAVKSAVRMYGFNHISWRILNAREFGLPQDRNRLFIVASKHPSHALALHREIPIRHQSTSTPEVHGFYWTGGKRSICYSTGCVPALKVGATDNRGRGTVAVFNGRNVRKLTVAENLALQGFSSFAPPRLAASTLLRMAGNAVAKPVGEFVVSSVMHASPPSGMRSGFALRATSGYFDGEIEWAIDHKPSPLASNLAEFLEPGMHPPLSAQASAGVIVRSVRAATPMPPDLFDALYKQSLVRGGRIHPSRGDSLSAFTAMLPKIIEYRNKLDKIKERGLC
jgi:DNA (cytosine-5)-methyltransferase 1